MRHSIKNRFNGEHIKLLSIVGMCTAVVVKSMYWLEHKDELESAHFVSDVIEKQEFLDALSHELQTPLTTLIASSQKLPG